MQQEEDLSLSPCLAGTLFGILHTKHRKQHADCSDLMVREGRQKAAPFVTSEAHVYFTGERAGETPAPKQKPRTAHCYLGSHYMSTPRHPTNWLVNCHGPYT